MSISDGQKANAANFNEAFADKYFQTIAAGTNQTIVNNQSSPASVTDLVIDKTECRSVRVRWQVYRKSTGGGGETRFQLGEFMLWHDDTTWFLTSCFESSEYDGGVTFTVDDSTGQVKYASDNQPGTYAAGTSVLTWQIIHTGRL